jgi:hypothetical protein
MRAIVESFMCLTAMAGVVAAPAAEHPGNSAPAQTPTYYLRGYYKIDSQLPVWQDSDSAPWVQAKTNAPWVNRRIVKWGYVPFTHDSRNYYCLIDDKPRTGSHVQDTTFICGDPAMVESLFIQNNWRPTLPMIGGGPPLENSLRPRPSSNN